MPEFVTFLKHYPGWGYFVVFLGMFIEGEGVFLTASILAEQNYLRWGLLITATFLGVVLGDLLLYYLGRSSTKTVLGRLAGERFKKYLHAQNGTFANHYPRVAIVSKYIYFVNRVVPFLAGWHRVPLWDFVRIHVVAASLWITVMVLVSQPLSLFVNLVGVRYVIHRLEFVFLVIAALSIAVEVSLKRLFAKKLPAPE